MCSYGPWRCTKRLRLHLPLWGHRPLPPPNAPRLGARSQVHPTYLWTLPMFHCNGWTFPYTITMQVGTQVCLLIACECL